MNTDFLGKGFAFPLQTNQRGGINVSKQEQKIKESILIILGTQYNERVMRPDFGCNLRSLVFAPNNAATANLARHYVEEGLKRWEPRIALDEVVVENDNYERQLIIHVFYRIKSTNEPGNLVYPFYLEQ
ncbi:MAG: GPW/gp25 family protein [Ignavibacteriales bacterium]|jgi:phage baseplate assembly protein W